MNWLDIKDLERRLKSGKVSDNEVFKYLLAHLIIYSLVPYIASNEVQSNWQLAIEIILPIVMIVIGTKLVFDINSAGDNKDFFRRFLSLSFVVGIRIVVIALLVAIPVGITFGAMGADKKILENLNIVFTMILGLIYYTMLISSFKQVSREEFSAATENAV